MKLYQILMVAVLTTTVFYGSVAAEYQDDRIFGNGRFLRRFRNDNTKKTQPKPKGAKQPSKNAKVDPRAKVPTLATKRPTGKTPTPAVRTGRQPAARPTAAARPTVSNPNARRTGNSVPMTSLAPKLDAKPSNSGRSNSSRTTNKSPTGFGMQLDLKSEKFIVTKIDTRGNAHKAGLKKGDVILKVGGNELGSLEEFEEITKVLDQGDELEFAVESRGKKKDLRIQFGTASEVAEVIKSSQPKKENDYRFVPDGDDNSQTGLHSVLGQPTDAQRAGDQQRRQIEQMQKEIQRLKRQPQFVPASVDPTENVPNVNSTLSDAPGLSGPKN
jgi:hypothetical protein